MVTNLKRTPLRHYQVLVGQTSTSLTFNVPENVLTNVCVATCELEFGTRSINKMYLHRLLIESGCLNVCF